MKNTKYFSRFIVVLFLIIFTVPAYWLVRDTDRSPWSLIEYRHLNPFPPFPVQDVRTAAKRVLQRRPIEAWKILGTKFESGLFPRQLETAASDQFPLRSTLIQISYGFDRLMIRLGYAFKDDPAIPADMKGTEIYETMDGTHVLLYLPARSRATDIEEIDNTIHSYEALIKAHPEINFYVYFVKPIELSTIHPLFSFYPTAVGNRYLDYLKDNLPEGLNLANLEFATFDEYLQYFYRTDHHWTVRGTLNGYETIYRMLAKNYPEISPILPHDQLYTFPDVGFHGRLARFTSYQIQPPDAFEVVLVELPPYRIIDENGDAWELSKMYQYLAGEYSKKPFTDHYIEYYGGDDEYHEYVFENGSDRNLLIIGDSYVNSIETLLASHYHHTYCLDLRNYPEDSFSLSDFLIEHEVDDILFLGGIRQTIMQNWTIIP